MRKYLIAFIIVTLTAMGAEWNDPALPMADIEKPVYQWAGWPPPGNMWIGGKCTKVRIPTPADLKEQLKYEYAAKVQEIRLKEIKRGSWLFILGLIAAGAGFALHFMTAYPMAQRLSEWVLSGGIILSGTGLFIKKTAEYQNFIVLGMAVILAGFLLYKCKDWSISHLLINRKDGKGTGNNEPGIS